MKEATYGSDRAHRHRLVQAASAAHFLGACQLLDTPTAWYPTKLEPGERLYFMLTAPIRKVGGHGRFKRFEELPVSAAWEKFARGEEIWRDWKSHDDLALRERAADWLAERGWKAPWAEAEP